MTLEEKLKKMTIAQAKTKEAYDNLQKRYSALKEQLEILKRDTQVPHPPSTVLPKEEKEVVTLYTGISLFQLIVSMIIAFFVGILFSHKFLFIVC